MNDLEKYFYSNTKNILHKWTHYFEVYDRHFSKFRNKEIVLLEAGVWNGGSLQMWKDYFGPKAKIYGLDINSNCRKVEEENIEVFIGSQDDRNFLREIKTKIPKIDILIDDGGHYPNQQKATFEELFDHVKNDGIYLCEDLHTSYWPSYNGGLKNSNSFIEYSKNFIDSIHAHYSREENFKEDTLTWSIGSIHYYDSIVVVEKKAVQDPTHIKTGNIRII